jgi:hypothetical protein
MHLTKRHEAAEGAVGKARMEKANVGVEVSGCRYRVSASGRLSPYLKPVSPSEGVAHEFSRHGIVMRDHDRDFSGSICARH